jgi:hypothetical protein
MDGRMDPTIFAGAQRGPTDLLDAGACQALIGGE